MTADRLSIDFVHCGLEFLIGEMDRSSNRIAVGLIVAALMIGSSLIILAGTGPTLWGLPVFGLVGFATAFILGHHSILTTARYTHLTGQTKHHATDRINTLMNGFTIAWGAAR